MFHYGIYIDDKLVEQVSGENLYWCKDAAAIFAKQLTKDTTFTVKRGIRSGTYRAVDGKLWWLFFSEKRMHHTFRAYREPELHYHYRFEGGDELIMTSGPSSSVDWKPFIAKVLSIMGYGQDMHERLYKRFSDTYPI